MWVALQVILTLSFFFGIKLAHDETINFIKAMLKKTWPVHDGSLFGCAEGRKPVKCRSAIFFPNRKKAETIRGLVAAFSYDKAFNMPFQQSSSIALPWWTTQVEFFLPKPLSRNDKPLNWFGSWSVSDKNIFFCLPDLCSFALLCSLNCSKILLPVFRCFLPILSVYPLQ